MSRSGDSIRPGFLGLSLEYWALEHYAGQDPDAIDPVLLQLIRNLDPGQAPVIRIGGVTTDRTWWPVAGVSRPAGAFYTLTRRRLQVARALAQALSGRLIMGVQFEADKPVEAAREARAMMKVIGARRIAGLELGNEPERYGSAPWYKRGRVSYFGRPAGWSFDSFLPDYASIAGAMGKVPLAGPTVGIVSWVDGLSRFLQAEPKAAVATVHRYPLQSCSAQPGAPNYPTTANLLSPASSVGLASTLATGVAAAHARGVPIRVDEMNTVACGPVDRVAKTFASALWALDALFSMASVGVDGVNIHTYPGSADGLFTLDSKHGRWEANVAPIYYGLLMFAQATPRGSRLLQIEGPASTPDLRAWATLGVDGRVRIVIINDDLTGAQSVSLAVPGASGSATLERLEAPSATALGGVTLGGATFPATTTTGLLGAPHTQTLHRAGDTYTVQLPKASAALLTINR